MPRLRRSAREASAAEPRSSTLPAAHRTQTTQTQMAGMAETPDEDVSMYEVLSDRYELVNVRAGPAMNAAKLGQKRRGATVAVDLRGGSEDNWVRTVETFGAERRPGWLLVDGTPHGLGMRTCRKQAGSTFGQLARPSPQRQAVHQATPSFGQPWQISQLGRLHAGRPDTRRVFDIGVLLRLAPLWPLRPVATLTLPP